MSKLRCWMVLLLTGAAASTVVYGAPAPERLTPATFAAIKSRVNVTPPELAWQRIEWRDGFFQGLVEAQAVDRPILYWLYAGDPRGNC